MRDTVTVIHRDGDGSPDYVVVLTSEYHQEGRQWVGVALELGTSAFAETLEQAQTELHDAVELRLNELERLTKVQEYLAENHVRVVPNKSGRRCPHRRVCRNSQRLAGRVERLRARLDAPSRVGRLGYGAGVGITASFIPEVSLAKGSPVPP